MATRLLIVYLLIIFVTSQATLLQSNIFAQQSTSDTANIESKGKYLSEGGSSQDELFLKYVELLSKEAEKHRIFINNEAEKQRIFISRLFIATSSVVAILVSVLSWFTFKSADEVYRRQFEKRFEKKLKSIEVHESKLTEITDNADIYFRALARVIVVTSNTAPFDEKELRGKKILWVDDKQDNIRDYKMLLESLDVKITPAQTTAETVKHLKNNKSFDLIITNLGRDDDGGKNAGLDLLRAVRACEWEKKVVIFTRQDNIGRCKKEAIKRKLEDLHVVSGFSGILNAIVDILA